MSVCDCCPSSMCTDRATAKLEAELAEAKAELADWQMEFDIKLTQFNEAYEAAIAKKDRESSKWNSWFLHEMKTIARNIGYFRKDRTRPMSERIHEDRFTRG